MQHERQHHDNGHFSKEYFDYQFLEALHEKEGEATTAEIASYVGCTRRTSYNRLCELADDDDRDIVHKNVGGSSLWKLDSIVIPRVETIGLSPNWRSAKNGWGHSLHKLAPYVGGFPPELANYFIQRFTDPGDTVLDPFAGGGTTPLESALENRRGWSSDVFSYANILSSAKCNPLPTPKLKEYLDNKLEESDSIDNSDMELLENDDLRVFYSDYTLDQLLRLREVLVNDHSDEATYLKAIVCGVLHGPSEMFLSLSTRDTFSGSTEYVRKYAENNGLERPKRDVRDSVLRKQELLVRDEWPEELQTDTRQCDIRELSFPDDSVDLLLTSPPYMQVLDYSWNNWIRLWWLGEDRSSERDNLDITSSEKRYREFIQDTLQQVEDVLAEDSYAIFIVGDVKKELANHVEYINTAYLIAEEAVDCTDLVPRQIIVDNYDLDTRNYARTNKLKYNYDKEDIENKAMNIVDRCLILSNHDQSLPPEHTVQPKWSD